MPPARKNRKKKKQEKPIKNKKKTINPEKGGNMLNQKRIDNEISKLMQIKDATKKQLIQLKSNAPDGTTLRAAIHGESVQYYIRTGGQDKCGTYIKKKDKSFAELLAQIEYNQELLHVIEKEISELQNLQTIPAINPYATALEKINPLKRSLIKTPYVSDEDYCLQWIKQEYHKMGFREDAPEYYTKKGLRVRSKSEIIIAETLDKYEIPYLYEKPIKLSGNRIVHPDFTLLNTNNRKELYWEHFGMMDDIEYRNNAFNKIRDYESNGYYQGVNFIWTMETAKLPISTKAVDCMVSNMYIH